MPLILLLLFIGIPILELAILIEVGGAIGLFPTIGLVILTAVIGTFLIRLQGVQLLFQAREKLARDEAPVKEILGGLSLIIAGLCLLTPGFFTDSIGFLMLIPSFRDRLMGYFAKCLSESRAQTYSTHAHSREYHTQNKVIDVTAEDISQKER